MTPSPAFPLPVLRRPANAQLYNRAEIFAGALAGRGLEMVWLRNAADLFFLQLQGSGRILLAEGGVLNVVSAGSNGRAPIATERLFGNAGLDNNDLSGMRRLMIDPSYVFFSKGPARGALGAPLAPLRSVAVDPRYIPLGRLLWVKAGALRRIMVASDTGAPIHGAHRADIFFGAGAEAEDQGGRLYESGMAWQLVPTGWFG
jgi:membrane-bound lytic murein transglycosylase A